MMKTRQLFKAAVESNLPNKEAILTQVMDAPSKAEKSRYNYVFRTAAATLVLLLVVLAGVPLLTSTQNLHDFDLTVNAMTIEKNVAVNLTEGQILDVKGDMNSSSREYTAKVNVFNIVGDGITSIKFSCETGYMDWHDKELEEEMKSDPNYFDGVPCIARVVIPASYVSNKDYDHYNYDEFWAEIYKNFWPDVIEGKFPEFKAKLPDNRNWDGYEWLGSELRDDNTYEIAVCEPGREDKIPFFLTGKEITAKYCDGQQNVYWLNDTENWPTLTEDGTYTGIPDDVVTITATFDDGLTATKRVKISLSPEGYFLAEEI